MQVSIGLFSISRYVKQKRRVSSRQKLYSRAPDNLLHIFGNAGANVRNCATLVATQPQRSPAQFYSNSRNLKVLINAVDSIGGRNIISKSKSKSSKGQIRSRNLIQRKDSPVGLIEYSSGERPFEKALMESSK